MLTEPCLSAVQPTRVYEEVSGELHRAPPLSEWGIFSSLSERAELRLHDVCDSSDGRLPIEEGLLPSPDMGPEKHEVESHPSHPAAP